MKLPIAKKLLGSLVLCGLASGNVLPSNKNSIMEEKNSWALDKINLDGILNHPSNVPKKDITVAIIDSGVSSDIPQLNNKLLPGYNILDGSSDVTDNYTPKHGTLVAEIINMISKDIKILPIKVANDETDIDSDNIISAINYAVSHGANIINISLSSPTYLDSLEFAIARAIEKNCIVVASSGNSGKSDTFFPASFKDVISVGAIDKKNKRYSFSTYGPTLKIMAPGSVKSPSINGNQRGTSFSTPYVAGVIALLWQHAPEMTGKEITNIALTSTRWLDSFNKDEYGNGLIDVCTSYEKILSIQQGNHVDLECDNYWNNANKNSPSYEALASISIGTVAITALSVTLYLNRNKFMDKHKNTTITAHTNIDNQKKDMAETSIENINNEKSDKVTKKGIDKIDI